MKHTLTLICVQYLYIFKQNKLNKQIKKIAKNSLDPYFHLQCVCVCVFVSSWRMFAVGLCSVWSGKQVLLGSVALSAFSVKVCVFVCVCWPEDPLLTEAFVLHDG